MRNFLFEGNTASFGKRDLREYFASGCGAFSRQYLMYCEKTEQNPGVKFPHSAADAIVRYCLKFYRRATAVSGIAGYGLPRDGLFRQAVSILSYFSALAKPAQTRYTESIRCSKENHPMKDYQTLIGAMFIAAAILVSGVLISGAIAGLGPALLGLPA